MVRRETIFLPGHYFHIYNRGCSRGRIFRKEENYRYLLRRLRKYIVELDISVIAYCLMPNHYHFLFRQNGATSVGRCVQLLFNSYTKAFNVIHRRTGTLFEGPFKAIEVADPEYLKRLCRYIHLNPVKADLVKKPQDWEFSNYRDWIGLRDDLLVDRAFIGDHFASVEMYIALVAAEQDDLRSWESLRGNPGM
jgi:putative transposase